MSSCYPDHRPWDLGAAKKLLDLSGGDAVLTGLGNQQLENAVALHHILLEHGIAYLADEVGMGKTYVALAVVALFRHLKPSFKVLYIAPSANVRQKWVSREYTAFLERNVRHTDLRVRTHSHRPLVPPVECLTLDDWLASNNTSVPPLDTFLNLSTLSFPLSDDKDALRKRYKELAKKARRSGSLVGAVDKGRIKKEAAILINEVIPQYDLVIIDEAHLLKGGWDSSDRVRFLARVLGTSPDNPENRMRCKVRGVLLLSATPFDRNLAQLRRQLEVAGGGTSSMVDAVKAVEVRSQGVKGWEREHAVLRTFMVRRAQRLDVGGEQYSRNRYRVEHRSDDVARISIKAQTDLDTLKQRFFTALVQKMLIDHCEEHGGAFPPAMMASFEAYSLPAPPTRKPVTEEASEEENGDVSDAMDTGGEKSLRDSNAFDAAVISNLVNEHLRRFRKEPPHPKLEEVAKRLSLQAFQRCEKQLVFVRRLKSVEDLKRRLEDRYDEHLAVYLESQGLLQRDLWLTALREARGGKRPEPGLQSIDAVGGDPAVVPQLPSSKENLFVWFFRGTHDDDAKVFAALHGLPAPNELRSAMTDPKKWDSLIGEIDWRGWLMYAQDGPRLRLRVDPERVAARAALLFPETENRLSSYRCLQTAWLEIAAESARDDGVRRALSSIADYNRGAFNLRQDGYQKGVDRGLELLEVATLPLGFYRRGLGRELLPFWTEAWNVLSGDKATSSEVQRTLRRLDLHAELIFSLIRLDHPFIDFYLATTQMATIAESRSSMASDQALDRFLDILSNQDKGTFCTRAVLHRLAEGWNHVVKTNFAELLRSASDIDRSRWRSEILRRIAPHSPVDWASGGNQKSRPSIARRFRMPGYPMVLVSTSVLQEGEDLHLFCASVTHYGLSSGPIGIEQKNGRVDRVGALAHRRLQARGTMTVDDKIQVCFPHLPESLEWFQVRDLCANLNEYLKSLHTFRLVAQDERKLGESFGDLTAIPQLIDHDLKSPFEEPVLPAEVPKVTAEEVAATIAKVEDQIASALKHMKTVGARYGLMQDPDLPEHFRSRDNMVSLSLLPVPGFGRLLVSGVRKVPKQPWDGLITLERIISWGRDPLSRLTGGPCGESFQLRADCLALGSELLQEEEIVDVLARLRLAPEAPVVRNGTKKLVGLLASVHSDLKRLAVYRDCSRDNTLIQHLYCKDFDHHRVDARVCEGRLELSTVIDRIGDRSPEQLFDYLLKNNDNSYGLGFYIDGYSRLRARMVQPIEYLQKEELVSMCMILVKAIARHKDS